MPDEDKDYLRILSEAQAKHSPPAVPAMPFGDQTALTSQGGPCAKREHQDRVAMKGYVSDEWYALVHTPIPLKQAYKNPKAKQAIDKEWDKLNGKKFVDYSTVKPRKEVEADAKRRGVTVHFGCLMELCHKKNSELKLADPNYKGRLVFRGMVSETRQVTTPFSQNKEPQLLIWQQQK